MFPTVTHIPPAYIPKHAYTYAYAYTELFMVFQLF